MASNEAVKFDPRSRIRNLYVLEPLVQAEGEIPCLLNGPLAGGVGGDATEVHPAGAVLDENQHSVESGLSRLSVFALAGVDDRQ
jgi:hypothetical protein